MDKFEYKMYAIFCNDIKPKNIIERILYKIWISCGVSPSGLLSYSIFKDSKFLNYNPLK